MGYSATSEIFENMLKLNLYFEGIMNRKWLLSHHYTCTEKTICNNDISYRDAGGFGSMLPKKILK